MDIEEIDGNSSQEDRPPPTTTTATTKKRPKSKSKSKSKSKETQSPAIASVASGSSTLIRFLGPAGSPSLSAWEDVNRQCPVCQQTGFSSRSLALHVNKCLDVGSNAGAGVADEAGEAAAVGAKETAKKRVGNAGGRNAATAGAARRAGNVGARTSNASHAAGAGSLEGEGVARTTPQAVPSKSKSPTSNGKAAKKLKTQQDGREAASERQGPGDPTSIARQGSDHATDKARSGTNSLQPSFAGSKPAGLAQQQQPTPLRRRGLGLARPPRVHPTGSDTAPTTNAAAAVSRVPNGSDERALNEIARAQLSYVLEASVNMPASAPQAGGWLGTQLFPKPGAEDSLKDGQCADCCCDRTARGQGACLAKCGASARVWAAGRGGKKIAANENSRVRPRPASWGACPSRSSGRRGWLEIWPGDVDGGNDDDCWGDGDGYVTLRPFPSAAEPKATPTPTREDAESEDAGVGGGSGDGEGSGNSSLVVQAGGGPSLSSKGQKQGSSPAPTSRADRFLQVFARLQPARSALNLHESPPPSSKEKPKAKASEARHAEVEGAGARLRSRVAGDGGVNGGGNAGDGGGDGDCDGRQDVVSPGRKDSMTASVAVEFGEGEAKAGAGGTAGSCEVRGVGILATPSPKRDALGTLTLPSAGVSDAVGQRSSANINIVPDRSRAASSSSSPHCNSLGTSSTSVKSNSSVNKVRRKESRKPPSPTPTPAMPPTYTPQVGEPRGTGCLANSPLANTKGSVKQKSLLEAAPSVPPTSTSTPHLSGAMSVENVAIGMTKRPKPASVARTELNTAARGGGEPLPRDGSSRTSGRMIGRLTGASVTAKRSSAARDSDKREETLTLTSTADEGCEAEAQAQARPRPPPDAKHAAPVSSRWGAPRSRGALACRASSGLLRSADHAASPSAAPSASASASGGAEPKLTPAASDRFVESSVSDTSQQEREQEQEQEQEPFQGRKADVPQKGSLTVVCDHGATLRSSWSIDDSQEVGRLLFGASLGYDAVWYLDPADEDCVGVRRYRILPHPLLAPTGGWISERGRLRDDPYTIIKAIPSPTTKSSSSSSSSSWSHTASSDRLSRPQIQTQTQTQTPAQAPLGRRHPAAPYQRQQQQHRRQQHGNLGNEGLPKSTPTQGSNPSTNTSTNAGRRRGRGSSWYPSGESHDERASASATATAPSPSSPSSSKVGGGRRTAPQPRTASASASASASKVFALPGAAPAKGRGSLHVGGATSPPAKALEASDTGDKVTCPVCNRGMDHCKPGQRQQHVHTCLLKQSSSTKKAPPPPKTPATAPVTPTPQTPGSAVGVGAGGSGYGNMARSSVEETGPFAFGQGRKGREAPGPSSASDADAGAADSPRSTRVSLQGVFSPKPARRSPKTGDIPIQLEHRRDRDRDSDRDRDTSSRGPSSSSSAASPRTEAVTPTPTPTPNRKSGVGVGRAMKTKTNGFRGSTGTAEVRVPASKSTVAPKAKGPAECPVCQLHFGGRLGDWERQQHIKQCLESLDGVFDSEE